MANRTRWWRWAGLGGAAFLSWSGSAGAAPTPAQILAFAPRQPGVECTTPTAEQQTGCKVSLLKEKKGSGWVMTDASGQTLRKFYDSNSDNKIDIWSYYKDGIEVYREVDSNFNGKPDQYRWLNTAGTRWGIDVNEDGRIDSWKMISPEEVSQEVLQAVATGDYSRIQAVLMTEAEIKALELTPAEAEKMRESLKKVQARFNEMAAKLKGMEKVTWMHLESALPQCRPADAVGTRYELIRQPRNTVIYEASGKNDWMQTGEMVKLGDAWRLVEGPSQGASSVDQQPASPMTGTSGAVSSNPKLQKKMEELTKLDSNPPAPGSGGPNPEIVKYNLQRADLIEEIIAETPAKERENWIRQVADSLSTAAQNSGEDRTARERLDRLEKQVVEAMPGSALAAFVSYRSLQAWYSTALLGKDADYAKVQQAWVEKLAKFTAGYPKADDSAEALLQLGMTCEFLTKETDAKKWYAQLAKDFADKPQAAKGRGAVKRLDLEGKSMQLAGATLDGSVYDVSKSHGKVVVVYYWASWNSATSGDFGKLKQLADANKGVEVVCVNLDSSAEEANNFLKRTPAPGVTLHQPGGLESPLATEYGVMVLPNVFLVGKDGKVVSRTVQVGGLDDEVKKLLK
jgi:hypothetical protein